ncbi:Fasciclin-domain-containing protein [Parathielavia appendiculata]|uniref:Fasciclin-domain-containing protein n=1 Tax=Parathielavia appendiculata TaxID=2587402 RepID=A0AAN6U301_9PEZI|nr:Fasciclin-domain-containing protein [Parathielavia appendiculata]
MRQNIIFFAATAAALVVPGIEQQQVSLFDIHDKFTEHNAVQAWWDTIPNADRLFSSIQDRMSKSIQGSNLDGLVAMIDGEKEGPHPRPPHGGHGRHGHHGHGDPEKTIYELIKESEHTTKFAKLVEEHDDIKHLLQDTEHNYTLFIPTDRAFRHNPHRHGHRGGDDDTDNDDDDDDHKPSKEFILDLLKYHITPGLYPLHRVRSSNTLPSSLHPSALSTSASSKHHHHHPQRIRVSTVPFLPITRLNFHARLITGDFIAKNGLIHALDSLLIPPPSQTTIIRLLPSQFSTLALALQTTGLGNELGELERSGGATLFAPSNLAWARLGPRANAFLFSERGRKYLKGLLKYHVAVNETLYSDAYYTGGGNGKGEEEVVVELDGLEGGRRRGSYWHVDLTSLLDGKPISVDVQRWKRFVSIVVNGFVPVVVKDGVADDGVVHVVSRVLIPPCEHRGGNGVGEGDEEEVSVEELMRRLEPYVEETSAGREDMGDL